MSLVSYLSLQPGDMKTHGISDMECGIEIAFLKDHQALDIAIAAKTEPNLN